MSTTELRRVEQSESAPEGWDAAAEEMGAATSQSGFVDALRSCRGVARVSYLWDVGLGDGLTVLHTAVSGVTIGLLGFPLGLTLSGRSLTPAEWALLKERVEGPIVLILPVSPFSSNGEGGNEFTGPHFVEPESAIVDLARWDEEVTPGRRTRQNIRRAQRMPFQVRDASIEDAILISRIHEQTLERNRAVSRYTPDYFAELLEYSQRTEVVRATITEFEGRPSSFAISVTHGGMGAYLHGGYDRQLDIERPIDVGVLDAIKWAAVSGVRVFNLLRSPSRQPGLTEYKERWGGVRTKPHHSFVAARPPLVAHLVARLQQWRLGTLR